MDSVRVGGWLILANLVRRHPGTRSVLSGCTASFDNLIFTLSPTFASLLCFDEEIVAIYT